MKLYGSSAYYGSCLRSARNYGKLSDPKFVNKAQSGRSNFEKDFEKSHINTSFFQKVLLGLGSGVVSITSPSRGDMIAVMGEVTGYQALEYMRSRMAESEEGKKILEEKPRVSSLSIDLEKLKSYPEGTLGKAYSNFLNKYGYTPDTRNAVQFVDNIELAYIAQRYRESHDLIHTLLDMPTNMLGEVTVKWVEAIQFKLPMCATGALFGAVRLAPKFSRAYSTLPVIRISSSLTKKIETKEVRPRHHPGIMHVPRVALPMVISETMRNILRQRRKELGDKADAFYKRFVQRILPVEKEDLRRYRTEFYNYYLSKVPHDEELTTKVEDRIERQVNKKLKELIERWSSFHYDKNFSLVYLMSRAAAEYAVLKRVFHEIYKRDEEFQPKSLLDFGSGVGTVSWVAHELWGSTMKEYYCVDASSDMNELAANILRRNDISNEPYIKTVYFRQFFPATPRLFDIVVSSYSFFEFRNCESRMRMLTALWNNTKEYLVLIEIGNNWGFQVISEARDFLINISAENNVDCHIFAPCPHEMACPRLAAPGIKTPCNFLVQFKKFSFTNSDDTGNERFCYVIFRKKPKPEEERTCRIVRTVLRRHKHVVCKLCTPDGKLTTLPFTRSKHGILAYKCVKASRWGDLFPGPLEPRMIKDREPRTSEIDTGELISDSDTESGSDSDTESYSTLEDGDDVDNSNNNKKSD